MFQKVTKKAFYEAVYASKRDVHPSIVSASFPYKSEWRFHREIGQPIFGKSVSRLEGGAIVTDYFILERP